MAIGHDKPILRGLATLCSSSSGLTDRTLTTRSRGDAAYCALILAFGTALVSTCVAADEGGVSFWLPGLFGSFAAVPGDPGFSLPMVYNHTHVSANASKSFIIGGNLAAGIDATVDSVFFSPTYTFKDPVLDGQLALSLAWAAGHARATASVNITGELGRTISQSRTDTLTGGSDLYPSAELKWHGGNNNWMLYAMGDIPTGAYAVGRLANLGLNHGAIDGGAGYTYLDASQGHEASIVGGFTYNFENQDTHYQNGVDSHIDFAASQFLNEQVHIGVVGYWFYQLTGDSGSGATLGDFKSRVGAIGPEVGYFFPVGKQKGYVNLKAYWEFGEQNRAAGWNAWLTLELPL
jgi:hypothetical protein